MKRNMLLITAMLALVVVTGVVASHFLFSSNIDPDYKFSWSENAGWMNWLDADGGTDGVYVDTDFLSGYVWMENAGWINVGDGTGPYANTDDTDFGVNILAGGDLEGFAWGENIGWINFEGGALATPPNPARYDSGARRFRGYAWGENVGWINLDDATHFVAAIAPPPEIVWNSDPTSLGRTTRTLIFSVDPPVAATGAPSGTAAIRVTMVDLEHPVPGYQPSVNPLPKNFTTFDTNSNGTCSNGDHLGHHCDTAADCRLCAGTGSNLNKPCASDGDCTVNGQNNYCPTSVCSGDARRPCASDTNCPGVGPCGAPITYVCGSPAACTGEAAMSAVGVGGCARWVGKPERFREAQEVDMSPVDYLGARLQCTPYYHDWVTETATEPVAVFGAEILPNSTYSVQTYAPSCKGNEGSCANVSAPVEMRTRRAGDAVSLYNPPDNSQQPSVTDIGQFVAKFKKTAGSPSNTRVVISSNVPDPNSDVGVSDIVQVVDMAKQQVYPYFGPCPCPSLVTCGTPCPGGIADCGGGENTCIKLCRGGTTPGEQCNKHTHCGGGGVCDKECDGGTNDGQGCSGPTDCGKVCVNGPTPGASCVDASTCGTGTPTPTCPTINCVILTNNSFCRDQCGRCTP